MLLCAKYVVPVSSVPIESGAILVRDNQIADIGDADMMRLRYADEEVKDFGMAALTPGFIDLNSCIEESVFRGLIPDVPYARWIKEFRDLRERVTPEELFDSAYLGGLEELSAGITTIADTTSTGGSVRAAQELGLRGVIYRKAAAIDKRLVNYAIKKADSDIAKWRNMVDSDRITFGIEAASVFECHPELYKRVAEYASEHDDMPVVIKLAGSAEEYRFVKSGAIVGGDERFDVHGFMEVPPWLPTQVSPVNYVLNWGLFSAKNVMVIHGVQVDDADIRQLADHDVALAVCPSMHAQLGMGVAPVDEFLRAGMRVGLGTGAPAIIDYMDIFTQMRMELILQRASNPREFIDAQTLIEMGTLGAARALGMEDKIGSLEVGKLADVVAIDLSGSHQTPTKDPASAIVSSATNSDVLMTMVNGQVRYEQNRWHVEGEVAKNIAHVLEIRGRLRA